MLTKKNTAAPKEESSLSEKTKTSMRGQKKTLTSLIEENTDSRTNEGRAKKNIKSQIIVKYDVGFDNLLTIRGEGPSLSWHKGVPLVNKEADTWIWETHTSFPDHLEFKILINDEQYEIGENRQLKHGETKEYTPLF